jgi:hypothetical protein
VGAMPRTMETAVDLAEVTELTCGVSLTDSTTNGKNRFNRYKGFYLSATGKEKFYSITTAYKGRLKVKLTGLNGKQLSLFLLSYPHRDSVIVIGDSLLKYDNAKPRKCYIAVDGINGATGKYQISVVCPDSNPDLSLMKPDITPHFIEPNQANVSLSCYVKNIGNSSSGATKIVYWYSENNVLDAGDIKLDSTTIAAMNPGDSVIITRSVTMPSFTDGFRYVIFSVDPQNNVIETDETDNLMSVGFQALPQSVMDCSSAINLKSGVWFNGNTNLSGTALISNYGEMRGMTGKEVIHTISAKYNGVSSISFSRKQQIALYCLILSACNENRFEKMVGMEGKNDTISTIDFRVEANKTYYLVVDGMQGANGDYWLKATMPDSCPHPKILIYGDSILCKGTSVPSLVATNGYGTYQWLNTGFPVIAATNSYLQATESGKYQVEVNENNCTGLSNTISVTINSTPKPEISQIGRDSLLASVAADNYEWYYNAVKGSYITQKIKPSNSGEYKVVAIKNTCKSEMSDGYSFILTHIEKSYNNDFNVSPNPTNGSIRLVSSSGLDRKFTVKVFQLDGKMVFNENYTGTNEINVDISNSPKGLYLLKIISDNNIQLIKVIKE